MQKQAGGNLCSKRAAKGSEGLLARNNAMEERLGKAQERDGKITLRAEKP